MTLQPAVGARDLLPKDVRVNRWICARLEQVYRRWGFQELMPPSIERLDTLQAAGGIDADAVLKVIATEPLGLRPEMTASIARAAGTRLANLPRPLRFWYSGNVFRRDGEGEGEQLREDLQSGVELVGAPNLAGDVELISLLLCATAALPFDPDQDVTLLIGHSGLFQGLLEGFAGQKRDALAAALRQFNPLAIAAIGLEPCEAERALRLLRLRGEPARVMDQLRGAFSSNGALDHLDTLIRLITPLAMRCGIRLQLDPTYQPGFGFYDGVVLRVVCRGAHALESIASGGRYDQLLQHFSVASSPTSGIGFGFRIEAIRALLEQGDSLPLGAACAADVLVAYASDELLSAAMARLHALHREQRSAELLPGPCASRNAAAAIAAERSISQVVWLED
ncbi:MAG: ATP phosphoribosyltransferase regulatory subunit [Aphanocapsa feldmannii 277cV]|uniref:ATP phosphoribosyltransferase regulatory subunit n=1 Tax=Aphanocapsa feldmannii 277cV TaxID=2507553 RepID=A0A524RQR3_9CHRO|nr:MAG: ATP phosphoribosyltransferase regulatory subunit [Aphanocapsa feldmannii 277cV]